MRYISVILPVPLRQTFTYHLEDDDAEIAIGCRVLVHFGGRRFQTGIVAAIKSEKEDDFTTKGIESILDHTPLLSPLEIQLWQWIADYYMCSVGEVMKAALPSAFRIESKTIVSLNPHYIPEQRLSGNEALAYNLLSNGEALDITKIQKHLGIKNAVPLIRRLSEKDIVHLADKTQQKYQAKQEVYFSVHPRLKQEDTLEQCITALRRAPQQERFLNLLLKEGQLEGIRKQSFLKNHQLTPAVYQAILKRQLIIEELREVSRFPLYTKPQKEIYPLSPEQSLCLQDIKQGFEKQKPMLLHGITASGKTEVYTHLIQEQLAQGKQVLFLLPEIAITAEMLQRLSALFGDKISIYHSRYSDNQRAEIWKKVKNSTEGHLVLGARSAVFLPFNKLGLIIVDEEHESSYKQQEPVPHYHARDVAIVMGKLKKANILLGSATPAIESSYNAQKGKYGVTHLLNRYTNIPLPQFTVVNMKEAYRKKETQYHFSSVLIAGINRALDEKKQIILFQNRRGYSGFVECPSCGYTPQCPNCDISLSYHRYHEALKCHYCGHSEQLPQVCPQCMHPAFDTKGMGTEKILEQAKELFPNVAIERFDQDSVKGANSYENIIQRFANGRTQILIGTQMIAKGLDFNNVGLVAIMNADNMMNFPDYRSHERAFQLMTQVAGRAGRRQTQGEVILQSYTPDYSLINNITSYDYKTFYENQIAERRDFKYPPFVKLIKITLKHRDKYTVANAANIYANKLRERFQLNVLGPEEPNPNRIKLQYRQNIMLKIDAQLPLQASKSWLLALYDALKKSEQFKALTMHFEVDI